MGQGLLCCLADSIAGRQVQCHQVENFHSLEELNEKTLCGQTIAIQWQQCRVSVPLNRKSRSEKSITNNYTIT